LWKLKIKGKKCHENKTGTHHEVEGERKKGEGDKE
jgi:hypothetical protein